MIKEIRPDSKRRVIETIVCLLTTLFVVSACAPKKIALRQDFWGNTASRVGVALAPTPELDTHLLGLPLLQYGIIHSANSDVRYMAKGNIDGSRFSVVRDRFVKLLNGKGIKAKAIPDVKYKKDQATEIAKANDVDTLIILKVKQWGTLRKYVTVLFVPGPIGPPEGYFNVEGQMVSLTTGETSWSAFMELPAAVVPIEEPWDQKTEGFPNIIEAIKTAGENASLFLAKDFFGDKVQWDPIDFSKK